MFITSNEFLFVFGLFHLSQFSIKRLFLFIIIHSVKVVFTLELILIIFIYLIFRLICPLLPLYFVLNHCWLGFEQYGHNKQETYTVHVLMTQKCIICKSSFISFNMFNMWTYIYHFSSWFSHFLNRTILRRAIINWFGNIFVNRRIFFVVVFYYHF